MIVQYSNIGPKFTIVIKLSDLDKYDKVKLFGDLMREFNITGNINRKASDKIDTACAEYLNK